jgi:competence protein ComEC
MFSIWKKSPFLRFLAPMLVGIATAQCIAVSTDTCKKLIVSCTIIGLIYSIIRNKVQFKQRAIPGILFTAFLILSSYCLTFLSRTMAERSEPNPVLSEKTWLIQLADAPHYSKERLRCTAEVKGYFNSDTLIAFEEKIMIVLKTDSASFVPQVDDFILVTAKLQALQKPMNPFEFDYADYLKRQHIRFQLYGSAESWKCIENTGHHSWKGYFITWRENLLSLFAKYGIKGDEYAVLSALVLGKTDDVDDEIMASYSSAGAIHVLAVSGLHVGLIYVILAPPLRWAFPGKKKKFIKTLLPALLLWFYAGLTGFSPSVLRAAVTFSFFIVADNYGKDKNIYNTICASAFFLLLWNPFFLLEVGFQLSYLAVIAIVALQPKIQSLVYFKNKWLEKIWQLTSVSLAAQLLTFPLALLYFHQFPNYFLFSNLLLVPLSTVILYTALAFVALSWWSFPAGILAWLSSKLTALMNGIASFFDKLPYSLTDKISITSMEWLYIMVLIISGAFFFLWQKGKALKWFLLSIGAIVISQLFEKNKMIDQDEICVNSFKGKQCITWVSGQSAFVFTDFDLEHNPGFIQHHFAGYWYHHGIKDFHFVRTDSVSSFVHENCRFNSPFLQLDTLVFMMAGEAALEKPAPDFVDWIMPADSLRKVYLDSATLENFSNTPMILGQGWSKGRKEWMKNKGLELFELDSGAFILRNGQILSFKDLY